MLKITSRFALLGLAFAGLIALPASADPVITNCAVTTSAPTYVAGTTRPCTQTTAGAIRTSSGGGAGGGTSAVDDAAFTAGTDSGTPMMGFFSSDTVDSGDVGIVKMLANRQLAVTLYDSAGSELSVGGGTQYTEDAAAAANPVGNAIIAIRRDALSGSEVSANGDNIAIGATSKGEVYVKQTDVVPVSDNAGSLTVDNGGTFAVQDSQVIADDAAFTPATSKVFVGGFTFDNVAPDSVDEGDIGAARMSANRSVYINIRDNAGNERGLNIDANGALAATVTNATAANLKAEVVGAVTPANGLAFGTTSLSTASRMMVSNGTNSDLALSFVAAADSTGTGIQANAMYGQFDDASIATVTENRVAPVRVNSDRAVLTQPVPSASQVNALSVSSITAFANSENETEAKATAGAVYGFSVSNNTATIAYLTFYNTAAAGTTCGTNEVYNFIIPASTSGAGNNVTLPFPIPFSTAISYCITTGIGGTGSVAANSGTAVIFYK